MDLYCLEIFTKSKQLTLWFRHQDEHKAVTEQMKHEAHGNGTKLYSVRLSPQDVVANLTASQAFSTSFPRGRSTLMLESALQDKQASPETSAASDAQP